MTFITVFGPPFILWLIAGLVLIISGLIATKIVFRDTTPQSDGSYRNTHSIEKPNNDGSTDDDV